MTADEIPPAPGELSADPGDPYRPLPAASPRHAARESEASAATGALSTVGEDDASGYPGRPTGMDPQQLGFTPRRPVPWLSPILLAGTAVRVVLASLFGAYLDKRELQNALPGPVFDERPAGADGRPDESGELWLDYVADLGDGFNATYSVAYLLAQPQLEIDGTRLPRGRVLVMGGDQVYPTASGQQYEDRFKGPYRAALPEPPADGPAPTLYALPGNHDWYDGLTAFLRLFARAQHGKVGGWRTVQSRSYFVMRLPNRWWLFAMDAQYGAYLDDPQLQYFRDAAEQVAAGDRVIVCTPAPTWVEAIENRHAYDTVDYFLRTVLGPRRAQVRVMLSGDLHHYARYSGPDRELITAGGGGAYLYPTHHLPERIEVPPTSSLTRHPSPSRWYRLAASYPTRKRSVAFAAGVFARLPWRNPSFVALLGTLHMLLMLAMANAAQQISGAEQRLVTIPLALTVIVILGSAIAFAMPPTAGRRRPKHWVLGTAHGAVHIGLGLLGTYAWLASPFFTLPWPWPLVIAAVVYLPLAGLLASVAFGAYLLVASALDVNVNELFAGQGIQDAKGFLRLHFSADGALTIYPVAVDRVGRKWTANPDGAPDQPWFEPRQPLTVRLAEPPVVIR